MRSSLVGRRAGLHAGKWSRAVRVGRDAGAPRGRAAPVHLTRKRVARDFVGHARRAIFNMPTHASCTFARTA